MSKFDEPLNSNRLGLFLKTKREEKGLTQSEVARTLGYGSPQFISNIERGISSVPLKSLRLIIDLYGVSSDEIVDILLQEKKQQLARALSHPHPGSGESYGLVSERKK